MYLSLSYPPAILKIMRKIPLYQGKEQPLKKHMASAAADASHGSQIHASQDADDGTPNTEPRTGRKFVPKHVPQGADDGTTAGAHPVSTAGSRLQAADSDQSTNPSTPFPAHSTNGFRKVRRSNSNGTTNRTHPADARPPVPDALPSESVGSTGVTRCSEDALPPV